MDYATVFVSNLCALQTRATLHAQVSYNPALGWRTMTVCKKKLDRPVSFCHSRDLNHMTWIFRVFSMAQP
jgi:hypothetical protein